MNTESETQEEFDTSAAVAEISADLFGQGGEAEGVGAEQTPGEGQAEVSGQPSPVETTPAPQEPTAENSEEVQATGAPKTWSKEALQDWASLPPRAQQEILKREEDFLRGIQQYKSGAELGQRYEAVVDPFRPILQAENIDPVQLFQAFASNHYILSRGTPQQKLQLAAQMIDGYNIDFAQLVDYLGDRVINAPDPQVLSLQQRLDQIERERQVEVRSRQEAMRSQADREVEAFASDPAHPFFNELSEDIAKLIASGQATDLKDAYEKAVYMNPVTRQKALEQLTATARTTGEAAAQTRIDKIARSTAADVTTSPTPRNGTVPKGSIDDTLQETLAAIQSRG